MYQDTAGFPRSELFGLTAQLRRAAVSIAANITEGVGRGTQGDVERFLRIASGSAAELDLLLDVAIDLGYLDRHASVASAEIAIVRKMLTRFIGTVAAARATSNS